MKKIIIFSLMFLLMIVSVNALVPIEENPYFEELTSLDLFTIFVTPTTIKVGEGVIIGADEEAKVDCNKARLLIYVIQPDGKVSSSVYKIQENIAINQAVQGNFRYIIPINAPSGTWKSEVNLQCLDNNQIKVISKSGGTYTSFQVISSTEPCAEKWIGNNFCDNTGNLVLRNKVTCLGGVPITKPIIIKQCTSNEICKGGGCVGKTEAKIVCGDNDCGQSETMENCPNDCGSPSEIPGGDEQKVIGEGRVCCKIYDVLSGKDRFEIKDEDNCFKLNEETVSPEQCNNVDSETEYETGKPGILEDELEDKTEKELESQKCESDKDCKSPAECVAYRNLPKDVRETIGGFFEFDENLCVVPQETGDISKLLSKEVFKIGDYSVSWLIIGIAVIVLFFFASMMKGGK